MKTSRARNTLIGVITAFGLILGSASAGLAATTTQPQAALTFGTTGLSSAVASTATTGGAATQPCPDEATTCSSTDPQTTLTWSSTTLTSGCRFQVQLNWGDGGPLQTVRLIGRPSAHVWRVSHRYAKDQSYRIQAAAGVVSDPQAHRCSIQSATLTLSLLCPASRLSGPAWNAFYSGGDQKVSDLADDFHPRVKTFISAMAASGISVRPQSTLRSPQRSYLMHFSYLVSNGLLAPAAVPSFVPTVGETRMQICWVHQKANGKPDPAASIRAAASLLRALGVDASLQTPPALHSRHNTGEAIDMQVQWSSPTIMIKDAAGQLVAITSKPHDGTNPDLIAVGAGYGVHHFSPVSADRNHWSIDGH